MSTRLLTLALAIAIRQARRYGSRLWWTVAAVAFLVRAVDGREPRARRYRIREGQHLDLDVAPQVSA